MQRLPEPGHVRWHRAPCRCRIARPDQLAAALVIGTDSACDESLLIPRPGRRCGAGSLGHLPCQPRATVPPVTIAALARWFAGAALAELGHEDRPAADGHFDSTVAKPVSSETVDAWADLAAGSLVVAELAAKLADQRGVDPQRAYLLGPSARGFSLAGPSWRPTAAATCVRRLARLAATGAGSGRLRPAKRAPEVINCVAWALRMTADGAHRQDADATPDSLNGGRSRSTAARSRRNHRGPSGLARAAAAGACWARSSTSSSGSSDSTLRFDQDAGNRKARLAQGAGLRRGSRDQQPAGEHLGPGPDAVAGRSQSRATADAGGDQHAGVSGPRDDRRHDAVCPSSRSRSSRRSTQVELVRGVCALSWRCERTNNRRR